LNTPVTHLRDLRSELLLKLIIADGCGIDVDEMLARQHAHIESMAEAITSQIDPGAPVDVVDLWRQESSTAALRFLTRLPRHR
jgi:hypothetical protein